MTDLLNRRSLHIHKSVQVHHDAGEAFFAVLFQMADEHRSFFRRGKASDREAAGEVDFLFRRRGGFAAETFGEVDRHGLDETIVPLRQRL